MRKKGNLYCYKGGLKKMNKKYIMFGVLGLFALALVSAGLITYYGQSTHTITVESPVSFIGDRIHDVVGEYAGQVLVGNELGMENNANFDVLMEISDDTPEGITTSYVGNLELTKKTVNFDLPVWIIPGDADKVQIEYTVYGHEFSAEVVGDGIDGYELIYYADEADRFNNVAKAVSVETVDESLPYAGDQNAEGGDYNYCDTGEYVTCHGAKIWYIPTEAIDGEGNIIWSHALENDFYFESSLIQYNTDGLIIVYPEEELDFTPEFDVSLLFEGTTDITTSVAPVTA